MSPNRRKIKTEEKAKFIAAVWVAEIIQFLAALPFLTRKILKNIGWIHPFLSNHPGAIHAIYQIVQCKTNIAASARNWINFAPKQLRRPVVFSAGLFYFSMHVVGKRRNYYHTGFKGAKVLMPYYHIEVHSDSYSWEARSDSSPGGNVYRNLNQNVSIQIRTRNKSGEEGKEGEEGGGEEVGVGGKIEKVSGHIFIRFKWRCGGS